MVLFDRFQTFEYFFLSTKRDEKESGRIFPTPFLEKKKLRITNCPPTTWTQNMSLGSICGINRPKTMTVDVLK